MNKQILGLLALCLMNAAHAAPVEILPEPTADRTFQYLKVADTFLGTPLAVKALVPHYVVVIGADEKPALQLQAANIAYMLGQWSHDPGTSLEAIEAGRVLAPVRTAESVDDELLRTHNVILVGTQNPLFQKVAKQVQGKDSFIEVIPDAFAPDRAAMIVADAKAAGYLANNRLYFKSGAYPGFFNFVKVRGFIENGDLDAALFSLDDPTGIRGCGKPVVLAIGHKAKIPPEMMKVAQKRNKLVFKDLRSALEKGDQEQATAVWQKTLETCYACHQGRGDVMQYRRFTPDPEIHSYHQTIGEELGLGCDTCHKGGTAIVGYQR